MRNYIITFCVLFFLMCCPMVVNAMETTDTTDATESVEILDESVNQIADELFPEVEEETISDEETIKLLTEIKDTLVILEFTALFGIVIHYTEKWFKYMIGITNKNIGG